MTKRRVTITLDPEVATWIESGARTYGRSLSEMIRISLREFSHEHPHRFSTVDKARKEVPEAWRVLRKEDASD